MKRSKAPFVISIILTVLASIVFIVCVALFFSIINYKFTETPSDDGGEIIGMVLAITFFGMFAFAGLAFDIAGLVLGLVSLKKIGPGYGLPAIISSGVFMFFEITAFVVMVLWE